MTKRYRLLTRAQLDGEVRQPGYIFTLPPGQRGPHRTVVSSNAGGAAWRRFAEQGDRAWNPAMDDPTRDEPLYEEIGDE